MADCCNNRLHFFRKDISSVCLVFLWSLSISAGVITGSRIESVLFSKMRDAFSSSLSIVGLFLIYFIPLFITIIAVRFKVPYLIYLIALTKGFLHGFLLSIIFLSYKSAGWLICLLCFFSSSVAAVLLLRFWLNRIVTGEKKLLYDIIEYVIYSVMIILIDLLVISPFLDTIIY